MSHEPDNARPNAEVAWPEEELVAYLDGELDEATSRRIESEMATDPRLRERVTRLERVWEALDELEQADVGDPFTQTTLEVVAAAAEKEVHHEQEEAPRKKRRRWLIGGGSVLAAAAAGFLIVALVRPDPNEEILRDLPLLENLDQYRQIDDVDFLRRLYWEGVFAEPEDGQ